MSDDDAAHIAVRQLARRIGELLQGVDYPDQGFALAMATAAWMQSLSVAPDQRSAAQLEMLTHHTTAIIRLLHIPIESLSDG